MPPPRRTGAGPLGSSFNINQVGQRKNSQSHRRSLTNLVQPGITVGVPHEQKDEVSNNSRSTRQFSPRQGGGDPRAQAGGRAKGSASVALPEPGSITAMRQLLVSQLKAARQDLARRTHVAMEQMESACVDSLNMVEASLAKLRQDNERLSAENGRLQGQIAENERLQAHLGTGGGHNMAGTGESPAVRSSAAPSRSPITLHEGVQGKVVLCESGDSAVLPPVRKRPPTPSCPEGPPTMAIPGAVPDEIPQLEVTSDDGKDDDPSPKKHSVPDKDQMPRTLKSKQEPREPEDDESESEDGEGGEGGDWEGKPKGRRRRSVFVDADKMKAKVREAIVKKQYNVKDFYHNTGVCAFIAKSNAFEYTTLLIIMVNAIWIMVDLDYNHAEFILDAEPVFQVAEFSFCAYFLTEIIIRFAAFKKKRDCLQDAWFVFDSTLVLTMLFDTGLITILVYFNGGDSSSGFADPTILKMFRMMKITRVSRMLRLLRATPELMILIKGIVVAFRSVLFTLALLLIFIYLFAILFKSLLTDSPNVRESLFPNVMTGMLNLLLQGTLPDHESFVMQLWEESAFYGLLAIFFILMTSLTVMNMLVGVLVEVVGVVSSVEKEQMNVQFVYSKLQELLTTSGLDSDGDMRISKDEFESLLLNPKAARMVQEVGVDVVGLVDLSEYLFHNDATVSFPEFMDLVLQLRGSNTATVKDVVDLRKFIGSQVMEINDMISKTAGISNLKTGRTRALREEVCDLANAAAAGDGAGGPPSASANWAAPRPPSAPSSGGGGGGLFPSLESLWAPTGEKSASTPKSYVNNPILDEEV